MLPAGSLHGCCARAVAVIRLFEEGPVRYQGSPYLLREGVRAAMGSSVLRAQANFLAISLSHIAMSSEGRGFNQLGAAASHERTPAVDAVDNTR